MSPARTSGRRKIIHIGLDSGPHHNTRAYAEFAALLREYTDWIEWGDGYAILDVTDNKLDIPFGMRVAKIETLVQNAQGQTLYPSFGFQEVARQIHYCTRL